MSLLENEKRCGDFGVQVMHDTVTKVGEEVGNGKEDEEEELAKTNSHKPRALCHSPACLPACLVPGCKAFGGGTDALLLVCVGDLVSHRTQIRVWQPSRLPRPQGIAQETTTDMEESPRLHTVPADSQESSGAPRGSEALHRVVLHANEVSRTHNNSNVNTTDKDAFELLKTPYDMPQLRLQPALFPRRHFDYALPCHPGQGFHSTCRRALV
ncbi:hypothetical protein AXG93_4776s1410 [Marchantia polymorpha subsp. ruderalis]|uniref:Uncharacterized protein n=1 Tax=Marchantia polymorpha subsp. ruderalis TaxID=1480154 RepID=A0A176VV57_MARPO|nr:hypothetical protein AXG93_4776s1410 [Marchantia polymorpha subsp. ruderalis]